MVTTSTELRKVVCGVSGLGCAPTSAIRVQLMARVMAMRRKPVVMGTKLEDEEPRQIGPRVESPRPSLIFVGGTKSRNRTPPTNLIRGRRAIPNKFACCHGQHHV